MADTHTNVLVRMPNEIKAELQREALLHGRKLTSEINIRLRESLKTTPAPGIAPAPLSLVAPSTLPSSYTAANTAIVGTTNDNGPAHALTDIDRAMLAVFHQLPPEKQLALLSLFR